MVMPQTSVLTFLGNASPSQWLSSHCLWGHNQPVTALGCMFLLSYDRGLVLLEDGQGAGNPVSLIIWIMVVFLHQYCCVSLRHLTSSMFKVLPTANGNHGHHLGACWDEEFGGSHPPSSVCFVVLQSISLALLKVVNLKWLWQLWLLGPFPCGCAVYRRYSGEVGVSWRWGLGLRKSFWLAPLRNHCQIQCHKISSIYFLLRLLFELLCLGLWSILC